MFSGDSCPRTDAVARLTQVVQDALAAYPDDPESTARRLATALRAALLADPAGATAAIAAALRRALADALTNAQMDPRTGPARLRTVIALFERTTTLLEALIGAGDSDAPP